MNKLKNLYRQFDEKTTSMILIFNIFIFLIALIAVYLKGNNLINKTQEYYLAYMIEVMFLAFFGYIAPKIPYNRYVGLRLPWIVADESTWIYAHKLCRRITIPLIILGTILFIIAHLVFRNYYYMYNIAVALILVCVAISSLASYIFLENYVEELIKYEQSKAERMGVKLL